MPATAQEAPATAHKRRARRVYSEAEIEHALAVLAVVDGNSRRAARMLEAGGFRVPHRTLSDWATKSQRSLYMRVRLELSPHLRAAREERYRRLARRITGADTPAPQAKEPAAT